MDNDENLPKATVGSFVKENLGGLKCSSEFIDLILKVSREYISVISGEANTICLADNKKTIAPTYIYEALKNRNLELQIPELEDAKKRFTEENHKSSNDLYKNPEMVRMLSEQQEKLFELSRNKTEAQINGLDKISSQELSKVELSDLIKSSSLITESSLNPSQEKTIAGATSEPIIDEDSDNYED